MSFDGMPKDNPLYWSLRVGRLFGITIRLHLFFFLGVVLVLYRGVKADPTWMGMTYSVGTAAILFLIVLLHEFGHCWGARKTGGEADEVLLWPLGGLAMVQPKHTPQAHFITTVSGPAVNVVLCAVTAVALVIRHGGIGAVPWNPLHTFTPIDRAVDFGDAVQTWLRIVFGLSYMILLFNLLPIYPLDGGRVLHSYLWTRKGYREAMMTAAFVGIVGAVVLAIAAFATEGMILLGIAVFGGFTCYHDRQVAKWDMHEELGAVGYDFSKGYGAFDDVDEAVQRPGYLARRRLAKQEARRQREAAEREALRARVDAILDKVHKHGLNSLTREERRILEKETERQRSGQS